MALLDMLADVNRPQTFTEIVSATNFNKSTVHRLLSILTDEGLAHFDAQTKTYFLGPRLLRLSRNARRGFEIQAIAFDEMVRLQAMVGESLTLGVLKEREVAYLRTVDPAYDWGLAQPPAMREPAHSTATGKALLAFLPAETRSAWLDKNELARYTDRTITSRQKLEADLKAVRGRGYATSDRENVEYVNGIAVPIFNYMGEPIAALNIWALTFRKSLPDLLEWAGELKDSAHRISALIGAEEGADKSR